MPPTRPFSAAAASTAPSTGPPARALLEACRELGGCAFGDAKATPAFDLPARFVIHTVGPIWQGGRAGEARLLQNCYRRCLEVADEIGAECIAFPAISTGAYGYPVPEATRIAVETVRATLSERALDAVRLLRPRGPRALPGRARDPVAGYQYRSIPLRRPALRARLRGISYDASGTGCGGSGPT